MKELNAIEMQEVSGSGILSTVGSMVGAGIGSIFDAIIPGESTLVTDACRTIGRFIGAIAENPLGVFGVILGNLLNRNNG
ncbi:hypothetical protein Y71_13020 [Kosakonia radicincitans DSM 16656]|uniref:hypothetical protein n=1 Tax=Kosakonia TaxID=1330547 RepID=UPI0004615B5F|nr:MULTISPECIES: hypothetical protein [Kosakonia]APG18118.1 hypothetical protein A3780_11335 [Kosakonia radicincitans]ARD60796.1 hypothetical protein Y71_13020 [Kosakonia radicincitans DSM 16656]KDE38139.1 hypothetical protein AW40_01290 [Kosakonia radicincitans UMEnt01/12]MDD7998085.1 hypothetical protein [Kosakonia radicincitans]NCF07566.1 hypothetical protein [Kosakonia sp. MH5]